MSDPMSVRVEVWPIAADQTGVWLLSGGDDAWRPTLAVSADSEPHAEVQLELDRRGATPVMLHSTSWRTDRSGVVLTYIAVIATQDLICSEWPDAVPLVLEAADVAGRPPTHAATDAPLPRYFDVLMHGLRHLRYLIDTDATSKLAMGPQLRQHLQVLTPALAGMYSEEHRQAA